MLTRARIIEKARNLDFEDIGFTTAEPFDSQKRILEARRDGYAWTATAGLDLVAGNDPKNILPEAQAIIVFVEVYSRKAYPRTLEPFFRPLLSG